MGTIIGIIIVLLIGIWVYKDAQKRYPKNSSAPGFWTLGVWLLLIVFLPLYLIFRPKPLIETPMATETQVIQPKKGKHYGILHLIGGLILLFVIMGVVINLAEEENKEVGPAQVSQEAPKVSVEEIKNTALKNLRYDELLRNNEKYIGKIVYYQGKVAQVTELWRNKYILRVDVTKGEYGLWDNDIWANYEGKRILEDDIIDLWGEVKGVKKYATVLGDSRSIPKIDVLHLEVVKKAGEKIKKSPIQSEEGKIFTNCTNECSRSGQKRCKGNDVQTCGDYDLDDCLEWKTTQKCEYGCSNNKCIVPLGHSRQTPVSVGVLLTLEIKGWEGISKAKVALLEIVRGTEAWNRIKEANMFNNPPEAGFEYLLAKVKFEYLKGPTQDITYHLSTWDFTAVSSEGKDYENASVVEPEPKLDATLYQGASHIGWVTFQVAKNDSKPLMTFGRKYDGTGGIWFKLY